MNEATCACAYQLLYGLYGIVPIVAGLDKYFNYLVNWSIYLNPKIPALLNLSAASCMHMVGVIEIAAGILVLIKPKWGGIVVATWLVAIAINIISLGTYYDVAVRDIAMAVGAYALSLLSREEDSQNMNR
jgi:hypothetical protein